MKDRIAPLTTGDDRIVPLTASAPELDPLPWMHVACHYEWCQDFGSRMPFNNGTGNIFAPRPEYSKNPGDYA